MEKIPCIYMRGGTSKGPFLDLRDLPKDENERNNVLLRIMGSPDKKQIDGIGGAAFVTSKVVMAQPSDRKGIDIDYLFAQVFIDQPIVDTKPTCGNMMSGVAPFAIEKGWVRPTGEKTIVKVYNINTQSTIEMHVHTKNGEVNYMDGDLKIDGVPGIGSPILMKMSNVIGGATGQLFPTGNIIDQANGIQYSMVDAGNLMIHMKASDFGLTGLEQPDYFANNVELMNTLEAIRLEAGIKGGLGDVSNSVLPKIGLLTPSQKSLHIRSQYFTPKTLHPTHAVSGATCIAIGCHYKGTIASNLLDIPESHQNKIIIEHPSGEIPVEIETATINGELNIKSAGTLRTARKLMEGYAYY